MKILVTRLLLGSLKMSAYISMNCSYNADSSLVHLLIFSIVFLLYGRFEAPFLGDIPDCAAEFRMSFRLSPSFLTSVVFSSLLAPSDPAAIWRFFSSCLMRELSGSSKDLISRPGRFWSSKAAPRLCWGLSRC